LIFYPLLILGQMAAEAGRAPIVPAMWAGNGLTLLIGLALTGRILTR
jgi:lipopolysaccharide export LptBFGC system permease protein LptF